MLKKITLAAALAAGSIGLTAATATAGFNIPAYGHTKAKTMSVSERMQQMKLSHPRAYNDCLNLAIARGHSRGYEHDTNLMMFVEGCIARTQL